MPLINFGSDDNPDWRESNPVVAAPDTSKGPVWTRYAPVSGGSSEDAAFDPNAGSVASMQGGSWSGEGAPVAVGRINSQGNNGTLFKGQDGYYFDGKKLGIDDATARAWVQGNAEAQKQERESSNFGTQLDKIGEIVVPLFLTAVAGGVAGFGPLAGAGSVGAGAGAAAAAGEASFGSIGATEGLTSAVTATANAAGAAGMSVAPGYVSATGALEAAVGNAAGVSLVPGSIAASSAPGLISSLAAGAAGGSAAGEFADVAMESSPGVTQDPYSAADALSRTTGELTTHVDELTSGEGGATQTGWSGADVSSTGLLDSKLAKTLGKEAVKTVVKAAITGSAADAKLPPGATQTGVTGDTADTSASFSSLGLQNFGSTTFKDLTRSMFQVDTNALANAGVSYTPRR